MQSSHLIAAAGALFALVSLASPGIPRVAAAATSTVPQVAGISANVEHGRYIVEDIAMCAQCHSPRDEGGNIVESQEFFGAPVPVRPPWANNWAILAPRNRGLPGYDDDQAMRLLTEGAIGRDGKQLKPPMPRFRMTKQDAADVIAFMRSLR